MTKNNNINTFINEMYSTPRLRNYETNKVVYNHIDEIWSIDLADFKTSTNNGFRYIFIIIDKFSKYVVAIPLKNENSKIVTESISKLL